MQSRARRRERRGRREKAKERERKEETEEEEENFIGNHTISTCSKMEDLEFRSILIAREKEIDSIELKF